MVNLLPSVRYFPAAGKPFAFWQIARYVVRIGKPSLLHTTLALPSFDGAFNVAFAPTLIEAFPSTPLFVVISITPLAPLTPNTAVADASFNTEIDSTELISTLVIGRSIPSTNIRGSLPFHELLPRITIRGSSSPG